MVSCSPTWIIDKANIYMEMYCPPFPYASTEGFMDSADLPVLSSIPHFLLDLISKLPLLLQNSTSTVLSWNPSNGHKKCGGGDTSGERCTG